MQPDQRQREAKVLHNQALHQRDVAWTYQWDAEVLHTQKGRTNELWLDNTNEMPRSCTPARASVSKPIHLACEHPLMPPSPFLWGAMIQIQIIDGIKALGRISKNVYGMRYEENKESLREIFKWKNRK